MGSEEGLRSKQSLQETTDKNMKNSNEYYLTKESATLFENIKHIDENGVEFWDGRELAPHLGNTHGATSNQ